MSKGHCILIYISFGELLNRVISVVVEFDGNSWDAQEIADVIESMGLEARVSSTCGVLA